jgi:hypothetical protein
MRRETLELSAQYSAGKHVMDEGKLVMSFYLYSELSNSIKNANFIPFLRTLHFV